MSIKDITIAKEEAMSKLRGHPSPLELVLMVQRIWRGRANVIACAIVERRNARRRPASMN